MFLNKKNKTFFFLHFAGSSLFFCIWLSSYLSSFLLFVLVIFIYSLSLERFHVIFFIWQIEWKSFTTSRKILTSTNMVYRGPLCTRDCSCSNLYDVQVVNNYTIYDLVEEQRFVFFFLENTYTCFLFCASWSSKRSVLCRNLCTYAPISL